MKFHDKKQNPTTLLKLKQFGIKKLLYTIKKIASKQDQ